MRIYITTLTARMSEQHPEVEFIVVESRRFPLDELQGLPNVTRLVSPAVPERPASRIVYQNTVLPLFLKTLRADAFLATCNVLPFGCPLPTVVVVQSLQYFDHREAYGTLRGGYLRAAVRYASRHANALICVSASAKLDLLRLTGVDTSKVRVCHHGVSPAITGYQGRVQPAFPPYILCVATLYRYKNLERLIRAFACFVRESAIPYRLRIIGGEADQTFAELTVIAERLGVADRLEFAGALPHSEVAAEYASASVFVYPSLAETFGHPPLEAMTIGVPVVASKAGPIPEIVGNAAELVDPLDVDDIARGLARVLLDADRSETLISLGIRRAKQFNWDTSAELTFEALQLVLESAP